VRVTDAAMHQARWPTRDLIISAVISEARSLYVAHRSSIIDYWLIIFFWLPIPSYGQNGLKSTTNGCKLPDILQQTTCSTDAGTGRSYFDM